MSDTPVEVQFTSAGCLNYPCRTPPAGYPGVAHYLGLSLIFCGVMALVISLWEYRWINRYLAEGSFAAIAGVSAEGKHTPTIAASVLLAAIGIFAFFAVLLRFV